LRFISPGPAPHAATEANVGFVDEGQFFLVQGIRAHPDPAGVEHHLTVGVGVFLPEVFQGHQLIVHDRHFRRPLPKFFICHAREGGHPVITGVYWISAFAG
jgi:hypothetical protein